MKIRIAVSPSAPALHEDAFPQYLDECERLGFDTVWLSDIPLGAMGDPLLSLTFAAACTSQMKLGANIVPLGRHPLWLAKQLAQLDRLSNGRLLISFVPGLGNPTERLALGYPTENRGRVVDEMIDLMRRWWLGQSVSGKWQGFEFDDVKLDLTPIQQPLEVWLGGISSAALERVAQLADGWLTSAATPSEAGAARQLIEHRASELGRIVDPEHFGISMPFCLEEPTEQALAALRARRKDKDLSEVVAVGAQDLKRLISEHIDQGLSKFVVRPLSAMSVDNGWRDELNWLADAVLDLQT
ncbi:MAG: LLM class flavin-dependent oxidoreductase [Gammaproteobacteria bacterium]